MHAFPLRKPIGQNVSGVHSFTLIVIWLWCCKVVSELLNLPPTFKANLEHFLRLLLRTARFNVNNSRIESKSWILENQITYDVRADVYSASLIDYSVTRSYIRQPTFFRRIIIVESEWNLRTLQWKSFTYLFYVSNGKITEGTIVKCGDNWSLKKHSH